jgi:hypothetical protein
METPERREGDEPERMDNPNQEAVRGTDSPPEETPEETPDTPETPEPEGEPAGG